MNAAPSGLVVRKAGAVVLSADDPGLVALLHRAKEGDWSFPKGHVEAGEDAAAAVIREVAEETGLSVRFVDRPLPPMEYLDSLGRRVILEMFLTRSEDDSALEVEHDGDEVAWFGLAEVAGRLSHENVRQYYSGVRAQIKAVTDRLRIS
ncbi:MAG: NUDIX domain-containing protein [bacterium]